MSHANNFTADLNGWVDLFRQFSQLNGRNVDDGTLYGELFRAAIGEDADPDAGGLLAYPFRTGEFLAGLAEGVRCSCGARGAILARQLHAGTAVWRILAGDHWYERDDRGRGRRD